MIRNPALCLAVIALGSSQLLAQEPAGPRVIHVGDPAMNGNALRPYDNVWVVTMHYSDGRVADRGLSTDQVRTIEIGGKAYLSRIETEDGIIHPPGQQPAGNSSLTFNIFDPATMAPLYGEARSTDGDVMSRYFSGRRVTTHMRTGPGAAETTTEVDTIEAAFDALGGMTGLLLAALPLATGFDAQLPGIGDTHLDFTPIRVVGEETIAAGHLGSRKTWKVEIGPRPAHSVYWISKQAPYVIKAIVNGPKGYASWDMVN